MNISFFLDAPAYVSIRIYARPQMAIHQSWISVKIKRAFIVLNILLF
jgi:hypothetical protein